MDIATDSPPPPYPGDPSIASVEIPPVSPISTAPPNTPMPGNDEPVKMEFPPHRTPPNTPMPVDGEPVRMGFPLRPAPPIAQKVPPPLFAPVASGMGSAHPPQMEPMMQHHMMPATGMPMPIHPMYGTGYPQCYLMQPMMPYLQQPAPAAAGGINVVVNSNANANSSAAGGTGKLGMRLGQICPYCKKGVISRIQDKKRKTLIIASSIVSIICCFCCIPCFLLCCNYVDACPVCRVTFGHRGCKGNKKKERLPL